MFCSPERPKALGIPYAAWLGALVDAIDRARRDFGIEARIIGICIRHLGPDRALALAQQMVAEPHPYVVALGMGGDEAKFTPADFAPAYRLAHENGLGCTIHAGEVVGPESVWAAIRDLPVTRIGHGVRSIEDPALVEELARRGIALEVCPGSNVALGLYPSRAAHPLPRLIAAGVRVTLGSDDPPFFHTTLGTEYDECGAGRAGVAHHHADGDRGVVRRRGDQGETVEGGAVMTARRILALGAIAVVLGAGAAGAQEPTPSDMLLATLWNQRSVEYKGNALTVYALARIRLDQALADKGWTAAPGEQKGDFANLPPAIVLDVDETVLDNSPYEVWLLKNNQGFSPRPGTSSAPRRSRAPSRAPSSSPSSPTPRA